MKNSKYNYFYKENFLDDDLHHLMLDKNNWCLGKGVRINEDGTHTTESEPLFKNRYKDNTVLKSILPNPTQNVVTKLESLLIENGVVSPIVYNLNFMVDIKIDPTHINGRWHKDFNLISDINDPIKLWFTMLCFTSNQINSQFQISPTSEWPNIWNIGKKETLMSNQLFGHNMNLGHQYFENDLNDLCIMYVRWYDAN